MPTAAAILLGVIGLMALPCCEAMACRHSTSMVKARLMASAMNRVAEHQGTVNPPSRLVADAHSWSLTLHDAKPSGLIARLTLPKVH
jgi:hypothetical protein